MLKKSAQNLSDILYIIFFILLIFSGTSNVYADTKEDHSQHTKILKQQINRSTKASYTLPDIPLITESGKETSLTKALDSDTTIILNFIFTTCTAVCPIMSSTFSELNKSLADKPVKMISISIDPEYDTPKALRAYSDKFHANDKWHFFTGRLPDIIEIQKAFNSFRGNKMNHSPSTFIRMPDKKVWIRVDGFSSASHILQIYNSINKS